VAPRWQVILPGAMLIKISFFNISPARAEISQRNPPRQEKTRARGISGQGESPGQAPPDALPAPPV